MKKYVFLETLLSDAFSIEIDLDLREVGDMISEELCYSNKVVYSHKTNGDIIIIMEGFTEEYVSEIEDIQKYEKYLDSRYFYFEKTSPSDNQNVII